MIDRYDWPDGSEAMLRFGPAPGPVIVAALPLFEEANRIRTFAVTLLRALAERGIAGVLPDLPGQGESLMLTEAATLAGMCTAYDSVIDAIGRDRHCYALAIRSGALLDASASVYGRWHLAPQAGPELIRELGRIAGLSKDPAWWCLEEVVEIAGNRLSTGLLSQLIDARIFSERLGAPLRVIRYETDVKAADLKVPGAPLWRRAEPDNDPALAALLADDVAAWVRTCEG